MINENTGINYPIDGGELPPLQSENASDWLDDLFGGSSDGLPDVSGAMLTLGLMPKPFGMTWRIDQMSEFLKKRGYTVLTKFDKKTKSDYVVVVDPKDEYIPDEGISNIVDVFATEVQKILLNWLINLDKKN